MRNNLKRYAFGLIIFFILSVVLVFFLPFISCRRPVQDQSRMVKISTLCLLDGVEFQNKRHVLESLEKLEKSPYEHLAVLPFTPFLSIHEGKESEELKDFLKAAREKKIYLILGLIEQSKDGSKYYSSFIISKSGQVLGKYRKTHRVACDEDFALGNDLPVFPTPFGKIGLTITSDFYFPEIYEVLRMKGAEILVWQHFPERLREHYQWFPLLFARAMDSHAFLVTAHYADPRTYITNNYDYGMRGAAFGRSMVIDRSGTIRADTGYHSGIASAILNLAERKLDVYPMTPNFENLFYVPNNGGRAVLLPIAQPWWKPVVPKYQKRKARIAIGYAGAEEMWRDGQYPTSIMELLGEAREIKPDLILFSENQIRDMNHPEVKRGLSDIAKWASKEKCYVVIGGLGDQKFPNGAARIWDRDGRLVYSQPIYWISGAEKLEVLDTDFARIATHTCGDLFQFPIDRVLALQGAELILDPSQMWGPDGYHNELLLRARAIDNACYLACAHWNTSDPGLRSVIVDPYGGLIASSGYKKKGIIYADIDFSQEKIYYAGLSANQPKPGNQDIPNYFTSDLPQVFQGWKEMIFKNRRPELYSMIPTENEITRRYIGKHLQNKRSDHE